jgi:transcriptional regulator with XRE-family HTH domain
MGTDRAPREFDRALGERLRGIRESRHLSLQNVEDDSGGRFRLAALRSWETAERRIPVRRLVELAGYYKLPVESLLGAPEAAPDDLPGMDEFPGEVSVSLDRWGRYVLVIDGPGLQGTAVSSSRPMVLAVAEAYAAMRRGQIASAA